MARECERSRAMKEAVVRKLSEIAYSQQVYSKRCQFIAARASVQVRQRILSLWQQAIVAKVSQQDALIRKGHAAAVFLQRFTLTRAISLIGKEANSVTQKGESVQKVRKEVWLQ